MVAHPSGNRHDQVLDPRIALLPPLESKLFIDFHFKLLTYLANFDRASMAHGIEVRMPFMDWRLVTYVFALGDASRNGGGFTKLLLRRAMRNIVPDWSGSGRTSSALSRPWIIGRVAR